MKVPLSWLREYVGISMPLKELAGKLTMSGTEVKGIEVTGKAWDKILVGQIIAVEPHPNADRLKLATIDYGTGQSIVVCGDLSIRVDDKVPFARLGAQLIDSHTGELVPLKPAKIRGMVSEGMACSEKELGLSERHEHVMTLAPDSPVGVPLADHLGDAILDLEVTPNRPDCLSVIGVAREIAAHLKQEMKLSAPLYTEDGPAIEKLVSVEISDADLCRRYCASLIEGVKVAPSPPWLQHRLAACGMRPINNIVDVTNYVMLEYGQPLHAFDFRQIGGARIIVRRASAGEKITSLDGVERALNPEMLAIADSKIPVAIAGVMGGADSEVIDITTSVLLESANFNPVSIRRTSSNLKLRSEASIRFERGISPELTMPALKRATQLILKLAGGKAARGIIDVYPGRVDTEAILFHTSWIKRLLGNDLQREQIVEILTYLGFECQQVDSSEDLRVIVPYWRVDVSRAADLVEELARIVGYDYIPTTMLSSQLPRQQVDHVISFREELRDLLVGCGFQEAINYSMNSRERLAKIIPTENAVRLANPLSTEQEYLRTSLLPGLLALLAANQKYEDAGIRFFEIGKVFFARGDDLPDEREILAGIVSGLRVAHSWFGEKDVLDFFDAKGVVEAVLDRLGIEPAFEPVSQESLHPGRVARIMVGQSAVGLVGEVHPGVAESFDLLPQPVAVFELEIEKLLDCAKLRRRYRPVSRFPRSVRDMAVVVDVEVPAMRIVEIVRGFSLVHQITLFDLYTGEQVPPGKKSLAFRIAYQSTDHTLTDEEMETVEQEILSRLSEQLGATLRS
jgi:phenylalanyl-tRNA synthetase beta chain